MANPEIEPLMTRVGIPDKIPHRREEPAAPPLPRREISTPTPVIQPPLRTPELVPTK